MILGGSALGETEEQEEKWGRDGDAVGLSGRCGMILGVGLWMTVAVR